jgi:hypothetical protein
MASMPIHQRFITTVPLKSAGADRRSALSAFNLTGPGNPLPLQLVIVAAFALPAVRVRR